MLAIGFLELNSIAKGFETTDTVLKTAQTELIMARPCCPGKYSILFKGDVASVSASLESGKRTAGAYLVDSVIIPRVHNQVIEAISQCSEINKCDALGIMEFFSITGAIYAADTAVKAADITLVDVRLGNGIGGKSFVIMTGSVSSVEEAVNCGILEASKTGMVLQSVVIPNPSPELFENLI